MVSPIVAEGVYGVSSYVGLEGLEMFEEERRAEDTGLKPVLHGDV